MSVRKIFTVALAGLVSSMSVFCTPESKENSEPLPAVDISLSSVSHNSATLTIRSINVSSLNLLVSKEDISPDADKIVGEGVAVSDGKYEVGELEEETRYYAYLVGVSKSGKQKSQVKSLSFKTDKYVPVSETGGRDGVCKLLLDGETLYVSTYMDEEHDVLYQFKKCMYNNLYTFYRVGATYRDDNDEPVHPQTSASVSINATSSDNIGPIGIGSSGWAGGNHSLKEGNKVRTAETLDWKVEADGNLVLSGDFLKARNVVVTVRNRIYDSEASEGDVNESPFCIETVEYIIENACIRVNLKHEYDPIAPRTISRYYGMQSMFVNETQFLLPASVYPTWTNAGSSINSYQFTKSKDREFRMFIERRGGEAFQTTYLINEDLGTHSLLPDTQPIFIGNSYGKFYHVQLSGNQVKNGDTLQWHGIYTWYVAPLVDNASLFCHLGMVDGKHAVYVNTLGAADGKVTVPGGCKSIEVYDQRGDVAVTRNDDGSLSVKSSKASYAIVQYER